MYSELYDGRICDILLLGYHGWLGGWYVCVYLCLVYWLLVVPFDESIRSSNELVNDYVIYPIISSKGKGEEPHVGAFI